MLRAGWIDNEEGRSDWDLPCVAEAREPEWGLVELIVLLWAGLSSPDGFPDEEDNGCCNPPEDCVE